MKTKRITMLVEIALFLIGILLAWYFELKSKASLHSDLFCNLSVGMSTGGMVAFLIEIPQIINMKKRNILILHTNAIYIYMFLSQWKNEVQKKKDNVDDKYCDEFNKYYTEGISSLVFTFINLDDNIYLRKNKNKEIRRLKKEFESFKISPGGISASIGLKKSKILYYAIQTKDNSFEVTNGMLEPELTELEGKIAVYIKMIDDVIEIASNKQQLKDWKDTTNIIQNQIAQFK